MMGSNSLDGLWLSLIDLLIVSIMLFSLGMVVASLLGDAFQRMRNHPLVCRLIDMLRLGRRNGFSRRNGLGRSVPSVGSSFRKLKRSYGARQNRRWRLSVVMVNAEDADGSYMPSKVRTMSTVDVT